ncbi:MAG TPA: hypothetical protein ENK13_02080, partial [Thermopetrobacter sp.]|nr:hypothetical protein [Thermopetrobacter sp.]
MAVNPPLTSAPSRRPGESGAGALPVLLGGWLLAAAVQFPFMWDKVRTTLGGSDDAMRLVEWRLFAAGAGWYDMHIPRVAPPEGLVSH